ncbi:hypothetical protein ONZ51_g3038 [Trametes cubensis]|uniref:Uncharacterized protein n=1 Tax=Trametes cubensis TaxID=1111947 RepID=A0AAD7XDX0_9APHY|nr:hypothetical protein ONZ51_g3038 [Trametes cubensis]
MISALSRVFTTTSPKYPSAIILIGHSQFFAFVHVIPETGELEALFRSYRDTRDDRFRVSHTEEVSREQLGTVTILKEERDAITTLSHEVAGRVNELLDEAGVRSREADREPQDVALLVEQILKPAALGAMKALDSEAQSHDTAEKATVPVYIVQVERSKPDWITSREPKSIQS